MGRTPAFPASPQRLVNGRPELFQGETIVATTGRELRRQDATLDESQLCSSLKAVGWPSSLGLAAPISSHSERSGQNRSANSGNPIETERGEIPCPGANSALGARTPSSSKWIWPD